MQNPLQENAFTGMSKSVGDFHRDHYFISLIVTVLLIILIMYVFYLYYYYDVIYIPYYGHLGSSAEEKYTGPPPGAKMRYNKEKALQQIAHDQGSYYND